MHSLHPSFRNQTLTLRASTIITQYQTCRYFPKLRTNRSEITNYLFNIKQNPSHLSQHIVLSKSTETPLVRRIASDILINLDNKNGTILALIDPSLNSILLTTRFSYTVLHL